MGGQAKKDEALITRLEAKGVLAPNLRREFDCAAGKIVLKYEDVTTILYDVYEQLGALNEDNAARIVEGLAELLTEHAMEIWKTTTAGTAGRFEAYSRWLESAKPN